jgi:dihydrofolate synthase/folylpolyglutamate synthase
MPSDQAYQETIDYLYALQKQGVKLELANTGALMKLMGDPHREFRSVHIAGTNGKGSTSAFIAAMLQAAGYRVGLYTSPHLVSFTERIRINGKNISEAKVVELADRVRRGYQSGDASETRLNPTFFEVATAIAFSYFAEEAVDIAVVEVGMGGRLDSTNVIVPLVSVVTNIDLEHTEFLGGTLELIAAEKAGIIKQGVPVVTGAAQPAVIRLIQERADLAGSPLYILGRDFGPEQIVSASRQRFDYRGIRERQTGLTISLIGPYQVTNAALALAAVECLRGSGVAVPEQAVRAGLEQACWAGRLERVARKPDIYLDGAHNPASARMLAAAIRELKRDYQRLILVIGVLGDKDVKGIVREIVPLADSVIVTRPEYGRALDVGALAAEVRTLHQTSETADTVGIAIEKAREKTGSDDVILIAGSLYVVGEARAVLVPDNGVESPGLAGLKG